MLRAPHLGGVSANLKRWKPNGASANYVFFADSTGTLNINLILTSTAQRQEISSLRGKACKHIKAASLNDTWSMKRYSAINNYLAELENRNVSNCHCSRRINLMAVKRCSKAIFAHSIRHGKSLCFSEVAFMQLVGPDYPLLILPCVDVGEFLECAFWDGKCWRNCSKHKKEA